MKLKLIVYSFLAIGLVSCTLEKINISPLSNMLVPQNNVSVQTLTYDVHTKTDAITYSSELTNHISSFPKTSNEEVNREVNVLRKQIKSYVYALQEHNIREQEKVFFEVESSYKRIQRLRKNLIPEEEQLINRYLVKIKGNITKLESLSKKDTASIKQ